MNTSKICKGLATAELVLGVIGAFIIAGAAGKSYGYYGYERNWGTTIGYFIGVLFSVALSAAVLYGIGEILDNQEMLNEKLSDIQGRLAANGSGTQPNRIITNSTPSYSNTSTPIFSDSRPSYGKNAGWICPKCGRQNADYVGTCACGQSKN